MKDEENLRPQASSLKPHAPLWYETFLKVAAVKSLSSFESKMGEKFSVKTGRDGTSPEENGENAREIGPLGETQNVPRSSRARQNGTFWDISGHFQGPTGT